MAWFLRPKQYPKGPPQREMPDGLFTKCDNCDTVIYKRQLEDYFFTCPNCDEHFRIHAEQYVQLIFDQGSFEEMDQNIRSVDPLGFIDSKPYETRLEAAYSKGVSDAITVGVGQIHEHRISFGCRNFNFMAGTLGSAVGEKITRAIDRSLDEKIPLLLISASGGARMQEGALSLMQMAKTSAKLAQLAEAKIPYISLLTDPTTGGVSASYAMLGDLNIAEPRALIGFAGPRVIEQTIRKKLPSGFQRSEFLLEHGFLDKIVHRRDLRTTLHQLFSLLADQ